nr:unnamed protein product [Spirometra erinaceieuropaei]
MGEKATWRHRRLRHWRLLDYVLVRRRDQREVLVTKATPGADGWADYRLLISKMRIRPQPCRILQAPTTVPSSLGRYKFYGDGPSTSKKSSTVPSPSPTPSTSVCLKWRPTPPLHETIKAVQQLSSGKVPGSDAIPAEIYKCVTETGARISSWEVGRSQQQQQRQQQQHLPASLCSVNYLAPIARWPDMRGGAVPENSQSASATHDPIPHHMSQASTRAVQVLRRPY